ncbi:uncharacterized protein LOC131041028 [Cryptomeria japonica]|uniref:uncharacterized protein LOC131041028 n=1 Tax=Cryptomeria japonica TaxID=3369 RepID=UPI0027DA4DF8|nr:uncharacterized protein LOC131041028 [Cryptomeria japonica]
MNPKMIEGGMMLPRLGKVIGGRAGAASFRQSCSAGNSSSSLKLKADSCSFTDEDDDARSISLWSWGEEEAQDWYEDHFVFRGEMSFAFDSPPTRQEVEEAVSDLKSAFPFSGSQCHQASLPLSSEEYSNDPAGVAESLETNTRSCKTVFDWIEPELHFSNCRAVQPMGHKHVLDAFQLLQNSPTVQGMVISLASDKAIWDAVLKNEKVIEFRKSLQKGGSKVQEETEGSVNASAETKGSDDASINGKTNLFIQTAENIKLKVAEYMEKITELIHHILGFSVKKGFAGNDGDNLDNTVKSSLMLSIAVLLVVLVKSGQQI